MNTCSTGLRAGIDVRVQVDLWLDRSVALPRIDIGRSARRVTGSSRAPEYGIHRIHEQRSENADSMMQLASTVSIPSVVSTEAPFN